MKPGGRIVYATCSVLPEENEADDTAFLAAPPDSAAVDAAAELAHAGIALDTGPTLKLLQTIQISVSIYERLTVGALGEEAQYAHEASVLSPAVRTIYLSTTTEAV